MTGLRDALRMVMPGMFAHEGEWDGRYRHIGVDGAMIDSYAVHTRCELPDDGPFAYIQHNRMRWDDGRTAEFRFGGALVADRLIWETDRFHGFGWQSGALILLRLDRRDVPDSHYVEMIDIAPDGNSRMRTWQWYQNGQPWKRTLCDERRVG
jgi:hypothetical protein